MFAFLPPPSRTSATDVFRVVLHTAVSRAVSGPGPDNGVIALTLLVHTGHEGRAGMAAVILRAGMAFDGGKLFEHVTRDMPPYARPLFIRLQVRRGTGVLHDPSSWTTDLRQVRLQGAGLKVH